MRATWLDLRVATGTQGHCLPATSKRIGISAPQPPGTGLCPSCERAWWRAPRPRARLGRGHRACGVEPEHRAPQGTWGWPGRVRGRCREGGQHPGELRAREPRHLPGQCHLAACGLQPRAGASRQHPHSPGRATGEPKTWRDAGCILTTEPARRRVDQTSGERERLWPVTGQQGLLVSWGHHSAMSPRHPSDVLACAQAQEATRLELKRG